MPVTGRLTESHRLLPADHNAQQRTELQAWEFVNFLLALRKASGTHLRINFLHMVDT